MSEHNHSYSRGSKNPNSRNPAAGGGVRSSQHSPAVGNFTSGPQASQISPFQKAIFSACKAMNLPVHKNEISNFAAAYASANSGLKFEFNPSDIDTAKEIFQNTYRPQPQIQHSRNPNNLFEILKKEGKSMGIEHRLLIDYLKWYTTNRVSPDIAENPLSDVITQGIAEMTREISPGAVMFKNICEHGLSSETIGPDTFRMLMMMRNAPKPGHIWTFKSCPKPDDLIKAITFKKVGKWKYVTGFIKGIYFLPTGEIIHFNFPNFKETKVNKIFMVGHPAIVWASHVGQAVFARRTQDYAGVETKVLLEVSETNSYGRPQAYTNERGADAVREIGKYVGLLMGAIIKEDEDRFFNREYVTVDEKKQLSTEHELEIRSEPAHQAACNEAMAKINGIPVSLYSKIEHEEDERAEDSGQCAKEHPPDDWGAAAGL